MTQDDNQLINLTRRQMLAGVGAVGLASAGAGLGTSALFRDRESFEGNTLRAGELDLLVDWQQTYSYSFGGEQIVDYVNAWPDADGDGKQDPVPQSFVIWAKRNGYDLEDQASRAAAIADFKDLYFADLGPGMDWEAPLISLDDVKPGDTGEVTLSMHFFDNPAYIRMTGAKTVDAENEQNDPELEAEGVDEDDLGELDDEIEVVLWADDGDNIYEPRNGQDVDVVVLFDTSCSMAWADSSASCSASDNTAAPDKFPQAQAGAKALFEELLAEPDVSGLGLPADMVPDANVRVALIEYGNDTGVKQNFTQDLDALRNSIDGMSPGNSTELPTALEEAYDLVESSEADEQCVVIIGDGQPHETGNNEPGSGSPVSPIGGVNYDDWGATYSVQLTEALEDLGAHILTVHYEVEPKVDLAKGIDTTYAQSTAPSYDIGVDNDIDTIELFEIMASPASDDPADLARLSFAADRDRLVCVMHRIAHMCAGEVPYFYGSLADALDLLESDGVLLVGNPRVDADPAVDAVTRACLEWSCTYYVGFEWVLPADVGNEIQSDSVEFELGFEAEQCRNNPTPFEQAI